MYSLLFALVPLAIVKFKPPSASSLLLYQLYSQQPGPALAHLTPRHFGLSTRPVTAPVQILGLISSSFRSSTRAVVLSAHSKTVAVVFQAHRNNLGLCLSHTPILNA